MKTMLTKLKRLLSPTARFSALLFAICAASSAWATTYYWVGSAASAETAGDWATYSNWSTSSAETVNDEQAYPSTYEDEAVFTYDAKVANDTSDITVGYLTLNANLTLSGSKAMTLYKFGENNNTAYTITLSGIYLYTYQDNTVTIPNPLYITANTTNYMRGTRNGGYTGAFQFNGAITGSGTLYCYVEAKKGGRGGAYFNSDLSNFFGTIQLYSDANTHKFRIISTSAANCPNAKWKIFETGNTPNLIANGTSSNSSDLFVADDNATYTFGALNGCIGSYQRDYTKKHTSSVINVGGRNEACSVWGNWHVASGDNSYPATTFNWTDSSATLTYCVTNTANMGITGGGTVKFVTDYGTPQTSIAFSSSGGYINPSAIASTKDISQIISASSVPVGIDVDDSVTVTFSYSLPSTGLNKIGDGTLDLAQPLSGGDVNVTAGILEVASGSTLGDVVVNGGTMVVDLSGATAGVVFSCTSLSGTVTEKENSQESGTTLSKVQTGDAWEWTLERESKTFVWNGSDGDDWETPSHWLIDGETATASPTADDIFVFNSSAKVSITANTTVGTLQVNNGSTVTVTPGVTFTAITLNDSSNIAFDTTSASWSLDLQLDLITIADEETEVTISDLVLPATYSGSFDSSGNLTVTRVAGTYIWTGDDADEWATQGKWKVGDVAVQEIPSSVDTVTISNSESDALVITIADSATAATITLDGKIQFTGGGSVISTAIQDADDSAPLLQLSGVTLRPLSSSGLEISSDVEIVDGTTTTMYAANAITISGDLSGSGTIAHTGQNAIWITGDGSDFEGTYSCGKSNLGFASSGTSSKATYNLTMYGSSVDNNNVIRAWRTMTDEETYYFGAFNGTMYFSGSSSDTSAFYTGMSINMWAEIGAVDTVSSSVAGDLMAYRYKSGGASYSFTSYMSIRKVGDNTLTFTGSNMGRLDIQNGTVVLNGANTLPLKYVRFTASGTNPGGVLKFGSSVPSTAAFTISESTAPIIFDDDGNSFTWSTQIPEQSTNDGFVKRGSGALTLSSAPLYTGSTTVEAGALYVPTGTSLTLGDNTEKSSDYTDTYSEKDGYDMYVHYYVASITASETTTYYDTVADALADATDGTTITILHAPNSSETTVTMTTAGVTISDANDYLANASVKVIGASGIGVTYTEASGYVSSSNTASTWTGSAGDYLWSSAMNWSTRSVPTSSTAVTIAGGADSDSYTTIYLSEAAACASMAVSGYVAFAQSGDGYTSTYAINFYGNVTGSGTIKLARCGFTPMTSTALNFNPNLVIASVTDGDNNEVDSWVNGWNETYGDVGFVFKNDVRVEGKFVLWNYNHAFEGAVTLAEGAYMGNWHNLAMNFNGATVKGEGDGAYIYGPMAGSGVTFDGTLKLGYIPSTEMPGYYWPITGAFASAGYNKVSITATSVQLADGASITVDDESTFTSSPVAATASYGVTETTDSDAGTTTYTAVDNTSSSWTGGSSGNWNDKSNWSTGLVPTLYTAVTFNDDCTVTFQTRVDGDATIYDVCNSVTINANVKFQYATWSYLDIYGGTISGTGTLTLSNFGLNNCTVSPLTISCGLTIDNAASGDSYLIGWDNSSFVISKSLSATGEFKMYRPTTISGSATLGSGTYGVGAVAVSFGDITVSENVAAVLSTSTFTLTGTVTLGASSTLTFPASATISAATFTAASGYYVDKNEDSDPYVYTATAQTAVYPGTDDSTAYETEAEATAALETYAVTLTSDQVSQGLETSYYTLTTKEADGKYYVVAELADAVKPVLDEDSTVAATTSTVTITPTNLKKGLYYGIKQSATANGSGTVGTMSKYDGENSISLTSSMPGDSDTVLYYSIEASDTDISNTEVE